MTDVLSDLYSLGVMLYEMVTGQSPVDVRAPGSKKDPRVRDVLLQLIQRNDPNLQFDSHAPQQLQAIIRDLARTDPAKRIDDVHCVALQLS